MILITDLDVAINLEEFKFKEIRIEQDLSSNDINNNQTIYIYNYTDKRIKISKPTNYKHIKLLYYNIINAIVAKTGEYDVNKFFYEIQIASKVDN